MLKMTTKKSLNIFVLISKNIYKKEKILNKTSFFDNINCHFAIFFHNFAK